MALKMRNSHTSNLYKTNWEFVTFRHRPKLWTAGPKFTKFSVNVHFDQTYNIGLILIGSGSGGPPYPTKYIRYYSQYTMTSQYPRSAYRHYRLISFSSNLQLLYPEGADLYSVSIVYIIVDRVSLYVCVCVCVALCVCLLSSVFCW